MTVRELGGAYKVRIPTAPAAVGLRWPEVAFRPTKDPGKHPVLPPERALRSLPDAHPPSIDTQHHATPGRAGRERHARGATRPHASRAG
jgi:hypothetical protein